VSDNRHNVALAIGAI